MKDEQTHKLHEDIIILIHGLMRTQRSMAGLAFFLTTQGYHTYNYSYQSTQYSIKEHGIQLTEFMKKIIQQHPKQTIHFITHSLGGIIAREALHTLSPSESKHCGCLIMLAPPNQGSSLATLFCKLLPSLSNKIKPLLELSTHQNAYVHQVPVPKNIIIGIIAGRFDAKVPPKRAALLHHPHFIVVNAAHPFIMNNASARKSILAFLANKKF